MTVDDVRFFFMESKDREPVQTARMITRMEADRDTIVAFVQALRPMTPLWSKRGPVLDCCGTGGSGLARLNTSTLAAIGLAALGQPIVKFGGRAATGRMGSVDFAEQLELLRPNTNLETLRRAFESTGLCLFPASLAYPEFAWVAAARKLIPHPTLFNKIGPLLNPLLPEYQLIGVPRHDDPYLAAMDALGISAWVVSSDLGLDEGVPGQTRIHATAKAPKPPSADEIACASESLLSSLKKNGAVSFLSSSPLADAKDILSGMGKPELASLVAWNMALGLRMTAQDPLEALYLKAIEVVNTQAMEPLITRYRDLMKGAVL